MKFSTRDRYALRLMVELANRPNDLIPLKDISDKQRISLKYLEQIVTPLAKAGLVSSVRGAQGGYRLARPAGEITSGEILINGEPVDLKKHKLGLRELQLFARAAGGAYQLVDRASTAALAHPVAHTDQEEIILGYLLERPEFLRTPIVRDGQRVVIGEDPAGWQRLLDGQK